MEAFDLFSKKVHFIRFIHFNWQYVRSIECIQYVRSANTQGGSSLHFYRSNQLNESVALGDALIICI